MLWSADCILISVICQKSSCSFEQGLFSYICFLHMRQAKANPAPAVGTGLFYDDITFIFILKMRGTWRNDVWLLDYSVSGSLMGIHIS